MYFFTWIRCILNTFKFLFTSKFVNLYEKIYDLFFFDRLENEEIKRIKLLSRVAEFLSKYRNYSNPWTWYYVNQYRKLAHDNPDRLVLRRLISLLQDTPYGITKTCMMQAKSSWFWFGTRKVLIFLATPLTIESQIYGMDGVLWYSYDTFISYDWYFITNELTQHGNKYTYTVSEIRRLFPAQIDDYSLVGIPFTSRTVPFQVHSHINSEFLSVGQSLEIIRFFNRYGNL